MAVFKQNAHDVYEQNADFIHQKTLTRIVGEPSLHTHKDDIHWTSDAEITLKTPNIIETYNTIIKRQNTSLYIYLLLKSLITPLNISHYIYSKNKSLYYLNFSGSTTNTGLFFMLPSPWRRNAGKVQRKVSLLKQSKNDTLAQVKQGKKKRVCLLFVKDVPSQTNTN